MFTVKEALKAGIPRHALVYFHKLGVIEKIAKGAYRNPKHHDKVDLLLEDLALAASTIPNAIICMISALDIYGLTDQIPREYWLAIPNFQRSSRGRLVRSVRMRNMDLGRTKICIGTYTVAIFDRERCIIDAFRYLSLEIAIKALRSYLQAKDYKPDLNKLQKYAKQLRVNLTPYILSLTT